jgi:tetratricopeptide (TPR) repeat protein
MQVGLLHRARNIHTEVAQEAVRKMRLYQEAVINKRVEAQNAFLFAGRIAVLEGRSVAAVAAFRTAKCLKDDPDARLLIGQQMAAAGDLDGALTEYRSAIGDRSMQPATKAETFRAIAQVQLQRGLSGRARTQLELARELDEPLRDYLGLGKTNELLGDLWEPRERNRNAAQRAYQEAVKNFEQANEQRGARRVRRKLRKLEGVAGDEDGFGARALDRVARLLLKAVEQLRARARMIED